MLRLYPKLWNLAQYVNVGICPNFFGPIWNCRIFCFKSHFEGFWKCVIRFKKKRIIVIFGYKIWPTVWYLNLFWSRTVLEISVCFKVFHLLGQCQSIIWNPTVSWMKIKKRLVLSSERPGQHSILWALIQIFTWLKLLFTSLVRIAVADWCWTLQIFNSHFSINLILFIVGFQTV